MLVYEDLPADIKVMYSREQCEVIIKVADRLSIIMGDIMENIMENIRRIITAMQPTLQEFNKKCKELIESINSVEEVGHCNIKTKYQQYPPYKPKIKRVMVYRKHIYHHIRSNC